jgi:hypothetical protein
MTEPDDRHVPPEKLQAVRDNEGDLSRREFEHIHVCPDCLRAYADAFRERTKKAKTKPPSNDLQCRNSDLVFEFA